MKAILVLAALVLTAMTAYNSGFNKGYEKAGGDSLAVTLDASLVLDLIRLIRPARLGLWAEKHGVPALKACAEATWAVTSESTNMIQSGSTYEADIARGALQLMPKTNSSGEKP